MQMLPGHQARGWPVECQFCAPPPIPWCAEAPVFFEKLFDPFNRRNDFEPSGVSYPEEGGK